MVFVIATLESEHDGPRRSRSLYRNGLKLDVFYLGFASDWQYVHVLPEIIDEPAIGNQPHP